MKRSLVLFVVLIVTVFNFIPVSHSRDTKLKDISKSNPQLPADLIVQVGYFEYPGLTYTDSNGKAAGFVNEITMKTLEHAGIKYSITSYPAARFFDYLSQGKIDLFNGLSAIEVVKNTTLSSRINLFPLNMRVYSLPGNKIVNKKEDLRGHSVILVRGFTYKDWGKWIRDKANGVTFYETETHEAAFEMLKRGRANYLLNYKYIDDACLKNIKIPNLVITTPPQEEPWYCSFNIHKNTPHAKHILIKLEKSYLQLIKEGQLKKYN